MLAGRGQEPLGSQISRIVAAAKAAFQVPRHPEQFSLAGMEANAVSAFGARAQGADEVGDFLRVRVGVNQGCARLAPRPLDVEF